MTRTVETTCDHCGADLATPADSGPVSPQQYHTIVAKNYYYLELRGLPRAPCVIGYPPLESDLHFCGLACLREWTKGAMPGINLAR